MVTGVDPKAGMDPPEPPPKKNGEENRVRQEAERLFDESGHWSAIWVVLLRQHVQ